MDELSETISTYFPGGRLSSRKGPSATDPSSRLTSDERTCLRRQTEFPRLENHETDDSASQSRRASCARATHGFNMAFDEALERIYAPLLHDLGRWASEDRAGVTRQLWLPSLSSGAELPTAALLGPSLHGSLPQRLRDELGNGRTACITLGPEDYDGLVKAFKAIIRKVRGAGQHDEEGDESHFAGPSIRNDEGLEALCGMRTESGAKIEHIILSLASLPSHPLGVLQDLLQALHAFASNPGAPRISLVLWLPTAGSTTGSHDSSLIVLDDTLPLPASVRRLLDVQAFPLPGFKKAWEAVTESLWLRHDSQPSIWLGPRTWSDIEQRFLENVDSLEDVFQSLQLAIHHHFSTQALSALVHADLMPSSGAFEPALLTRARVTIIDHGDDEDYVLPLPFQEDPGAVTSGEHLQALLEDDHYLLRAIASQRAAFESRAAGRTLALRALCTIDELLGSNRENAGIAAMWSATLGDNGGPSEVNQRRSLLRETSASALCKILAALRELVFSQVSLQSADTALQRFDKDLARWLFKLGGDEIEDSESDEEMLSPKEQEEKRVERLSRTLMRDEQLDGEKRKIVVSLGESLCDLLLPLHSFPFHEIFIYDHSLELDNWLDPKPRGILLAALSNPSIVVEGRPTFDALDEQDEKLQKCRETALKRGALPDTARAYSTFNDAGKSLNLADWQGAFAQGLESAQPKQGPKAKGKKVARPQAAKLPEEEVQLRFAKSVVEMSALGMVKRTGRKQEHVVKTVFDLAP